MPVKENESNPIAEMSEMLNSGELDDRLAAARALGEIGDESALKLLRERLNAVSKEHYALVVAVGKLKKKLGAK